MTTRRKGTAARLRIVQVHSQIGNQRRVKRVLTDGLGLGRIGSSVVLPDNPYTRGMIAKVAHIVSFEEIAGEPHAGRMEEHLPKMEERVHEPVPAAEAVPTVVETHAPVEVAAPQAAAVPVEEPKAKAASPQPPAEPETGAKKAARPIRRAKAEKAPKTTKPAAAPKAGKTAKTPASREKIGKRKAKPVAKATSKPAAKRPAKKAKE